MNDEKRAERLERLEASLSAYYDIIPADEGELVMRAEFHARGEKYLVIREVNMWSAEDHDYVYVYSGGHLDGRTFDRNVSHTLEDGMARIRPGPEHRSSTLTSIMIYDSIDKCTAKTLKRYSYHRSFRMMLNGWMDHRVSAVITDSSEVVLDRRSGGLRKSLERIATDSDME